MTLAQVVYQMSTDTDFASKLFSSPESTLETRGLKLSKEELAFITELARPEGRIEAVWQDGVMSNGEIFHKSSLYGKPALTEPARNLSDTEGLSECPSIAISGKTTYVVWEDSNIRKP